MARVPLNPRVSAYGQQQMPQYQQVIGEKYEDLREGPINPRDITKNGGVLFSFINQIAKGVAETESNELAVRNYVGSAKDRNSIFNSKIPELERVGK